MEQARLQTGALCLLLLGVTAALVCPDGGMCQDRDTCCRNTEGGYGCCPLPHAQCCSDRRHCCFQGTECDLLHQRCVNKTESLPWIRPVPIRPAPLGTKLKAVVCPDRQSECPDETTCCQLQDQTWGCCPLAKAVCCEDKLHCCPEGSTCDLEHSRCVTASAGFLPLLLKMPAQRPRDIVCPDRMSVCPEETTCCQMSNSSYGCCPMPSAVCCDDHVHCCPQGTVCNLKAQTCDDPAGGSVTPLLDKVSPAAVPSPAVPSPAVPSPATNSQCDKSTSCPGKSTCCRTPGGAWACCPLPQAVCCEDLVHCCPHGTVCNMAAQTCDDPSGSSPSVRWLDKTRTARCDGETACPAGTSCCFMRGAGRWGCCPLPDAVCCSDGTHCCPSGHSCDPQSGSCSRGPVVVPWFSKQSSQSVVPWFSKQSSQSVVPWFSKQSSQSVVPWFSKQSSRSDPSAVGDVKCDDKSSCATGATCCKLPSGEWGCCPLIKAVCCSDHQHCCPQGYSCNLESETCEKKSQSSVSVSVPQSALVRPLL